MKQAEDLTLADFERYPLWVGVRDHDVDEPWFETANERTYRPWTGMTPLTRKSPFSPTLVAAKFELADGSVCPGCFHPVGEDWDVPLPPRRMRDGNYTKPLQWSARRGQTALSVLALHCPAIFVEGRTFGFHLLRQPERRRECVQSFYKTLGKRPSEVFPVHFKASSGLTDGICAGRLDGFFSFPLDKPFEIDTGESFLND
jgi:hypothetical protein